MSAKPLDPTPPPEGKGGAAGDQPEGNKGVRRTVEALLKGRKLTDTGQPGGGQGRVDITGIVPGDIRVDPEITEGHPGYQESGDSEIIPAERLAKGGSAPEGDAAG